MSTNGTATPSDPPSSDTPSPSPSPSPSPPPNSPSESPTEPSSAAVPTPDPSSSTPVSITPSSPPPSQQPSSSAPPPSQSSPPPATSTPAPPSSPTVVITASSQAPSTVVYTSVVTPSARPGESQLPPSTLLVTQTVPAADPAQPTGNGPSAAPSSTTSSPAGLQDVNKAKNGGGGLSTGGKTAIAVVVPVVVVGLLVLAGIILWRRRKQRKNAEEARRKEVEEYGYNPNHDPTLPAVGVASEMSEDQSGYRGWGNTTTSSNRKASTTLNSGMTYSDSNSNPGGPGSPTQAHSDSQSNDPLMNGRRETLDEEGISALGAAPTAYQNQPGVHRGPSNASSSYSAADHSDNSGDYPIPMNNPQDYYDSTGYYQPNRYNDGYGAGPAPVIRDVSARRNTRIESPTVFPQQGNSGIAQNF